MIRKFTYEMLVFGVNRYLDLCSLPMARTLNRTGSQKSVIIESSV